MTSGGRRANVVVVDTVQFKKDVQAFIEREDTFTTRVAIDGDVKDGWMPFEIPLEVKQDRWKVVVLRKQFDETASYAAYVCILVSLHTDEVVPIRWFATLSDEDYEGKPDFEMAVEQFLETLTHK